MNELKNWGMDQLHQYARENAITDSQILDWLNFNMGAERSFWYGQRTLREAVLMAMVNDIDSRKEKA